MKNIKLGLKKVVAAAGIVAAGVKNKAVAIVGGAVAVGAASTASAQTDATALATNVQTALGTVAPIAITIAGFFLILALAKRAARA